MGIVHNKKIINKMILKKQAKYQEKIKSLNKELRAARKEFADAEIQMEGVENRFYRAESNLKDIKLKIKKLKQTK